MGDKDCIGESGKNISFFNSSIVLEVKSKTSKDVWLSTKLGDF